MIIEVDGDLDNPYIFPIVDDFEEWLINLTVPTLTN